MSRPSAPDRGRWPSPSEGGAEYSSGKDGGWQKHPEEDGWGPSTSVRAGAPTRKPGAPATKHSAPPVVRSGRAPRPGRAVNYPDPQRRNDPHDGWTPAGAGGAAAQRGPRQEFDLRTGAPERGLPWWAALLILVAIAAVGGVIDTLGSIQVKGGFNFGIVAASVVAILVVKRSHMFPVVIAPPIVYSGAALFQLYVRSSGLNDRKVILDAAANYLVYGFPAIAAASAAVMIIAGIRLITRR